MGRKDKSQMHLPKARGLGNLRAKEYRNRAVGGVCSVGKAAVVSVLRRRH